MKQVLKILILAAIPGMASAGSCLPVVGTVKLVPDTGCNIIKKYPLEQYPQPPFYVGQCYQTTLKLLGFGTSTGYSGVTVEPVFNNLNPEGSSTTTPARTLSGQSILTARSWISVNGTNVGTGNTEIYTAELIVGSDSSPAPKRVTEQSVIQKAERGLFNGVSGSFVINGNSIGREAPIQGEFCFP